MDSNLQALLTELIKAILSVLLPFIAYQITRAIQIRSKEIKIRIGEVNWYYLSTIVEAVVKAAEQNGLKNELENTAEAKRAWAISEVQRILSERGMGEVSVESILVLIEAKIREGVHKGYQSNDGLVL